MNTEETFVPFTPTRSASAGGAEPRGTKSGRTDDRAGFVPGMPPAGGESEADADAGRARTAEPRSTTPPHAAGPSATVVAPRPHAEHSAPRVTLTREGDKVTGIRVECTCGQVIELDCVY